MDAAGVGPVRSKVGRVAVAVFGLVVSGESMPAAEPDTYVEQLSCTKGPFRVRLPKTYKALRAMAPLKREKILNTTDWGTYKTYDRELRFVGLEVVVVTFSNRPGKYIISKATLSTPKWNAGGQLKVGSPAKTALRGLPIKEIPREAELEFNGDTDTVRITVSGGRVQEVDYACYTG